MRLLRFVCAASIAVAACGPNVPTQAPSPATTTGPSSTSPASSDVPTAPSATSSVRACGPNEAQAGGVWWAGATGAVQGGLHIYAAGAQPCTVRGPVAFRILDREGAPLSVVIRMIDPNPAHEVVLLPGLGTPSPAGGLVAGRGQVLVHWSNWCGPATIGRGIVEIDLPDVGPLSVPFAPPSPPRCDNPNTDSVIAVEPIAAEVPGE
jgi:hypothetical protein